MRHRLYPSPVIGHRGACALAPENTLASLRRAAADGAAMVEVDVKLTAEGRPILFHDDRLERTSDGVGPVASTDLSVISALDAGQWFSADYAGEPIPTLEEALETALDLGLALNLEIKPCPGREDETAHLALSTALECWPQDHPAPPLVSSFSRASLAVARQVAPHWPRALIADHLPEDWAEAALVLDLAAAHLGVAGHLGSAGLGEEQVQRCREGGHSVAVWTVNSPDTARRLFGLGVQAVFSDNPGAMLNALLTKN